MRNEELMERLSEAVAAELSTCLWAIANPHDKSDCGGWEELPVWVRDKYLEAARSSLRVGLESLRDLGPSEEMRNAGCLPLESCGFVHNPEPAFTAMLTSLLGDPR